ncbi:hypothetical protein [Kribbella sp. CA-293567]|uniref:hypothetical protein n=1 Tax=Kribbella sp. CA-293567 TaxID=3002436 RepID=UPI0022DCF7EA|nr:hypothetical protein [Kribbella sp. CA-293567]WBQ08100.1 hypothetical protein OX958_15150 [Kribbella sp. CA-293567]
MAKAKRASDRSANDMVGNGPARNGQNGRAPLTVRNGHAPSGAAPTGAATTGNGPNAPGPNGPGPGSDVPAGPGTRPGRLVPPDPVRPAAPAPEPSRPSGFGTPVKVDEIALAAIALSEGLIAATRSLPESVASRQLRRDLDRAADTFRAVAGELETTAGNLIRLAAAEGQTCGVTWGLCEDHGLTLMAVGEVVTCHVLGCYREQQSVIERCTQPVAYRVVDVAGPALLTCAGHAIACRLHLDGAVITLATDSLELL